jgi:hypothetical protein
LSINAIAPAPSADFCWPAVIFDFERKLTTVCVGSLSGSVS